MLCYIICAGIYPIIHKNIIVQNVQCAGVPLLIAWVAKLMDSTTTVTLLYIRQYEYLPITHHLRYYHCRQANNKMNFGIWTPKNT